MGKTPGEKTGKFGEWLTNYFEESDSDLKVYYDHGKSHINSNVKDVQAFVGKNEKVTNRNQIALIDIMIAKGNEVQYLIEIEESELSPKGYFADIFAMIFADRIAVSMKDKKPDPHEYFEITSDTRGIVAGFQNDRGDKLRKMKETIIPHLGSVTGVEGGIKPQNIQLIFCDTIEKTIAALKNEFQIPT